jgi:hypothetical protein
MFWGLLNKGSLYKTYKNLNWYKTQGDSCSHLWTTIRSLRYTTYNNYYKKLQCSFIVSAKRRLFL